MKKVHFFLVLFSVSLWASAQVKQESVSSLFQSFRYDPDPEAGAVIVYDIGETNFIDSDQFGFVLSFKRRCRMKILSDPGLEYAQLAVPLYTDGNRCEFLNGIKSITYNEENGLIASTVLENNMLYEEKINKNWVRKKVAFPGVKVGSVIDFEYTIESPFLFNIQDWEFQHEIPVIYSEYTAKMIPFYGYIYIAIGTKKFDEFEAVEATGLDRSFRGIKYRDMIYRFAMHNVPAFKDDEFISSPSDYKIKIDFQLNQINRTDGTVEQIMTTWKKLSADLLKEEAFGKYLNSCRGEAKKLLETHPVSTANQVEALENLVQLVKTTFVWDGFYSYFSNERSKELIKKKTGNVAGINLFLVALLREAGIKADPVITSTRDHGKIYSDYPFAHFFNYVLAMAEIDGKLYLVDATEKKTVFNQLPERCLNDKGLVVEKGNERWVNLSAQSGSFESEMLYCKLVSSSDTVACTYSLVAAGYDGIRQKKLYLKNTNDYLAERMGAWFEKTGKSKAVASDSVLNFSYFAEGAFLINRIGNIVVLHPFQGLGVRTNPFTRKVRTYPVDMIYQKQRSYKAIYTIPEQADIIKFPADQTISDENFELTCTFTREGEQFMASINFRLKKIIYPVDQYLALHQFFDRLTQVFNQEVQIKLN